MESFYLIVLIIAVVFMIIGLTVSAMMLKHQNTDEVFPKTHSPCPDGWESNPTVKANPNKNYNKQYLNSCKIPYGIGNGDPIESPPNTQDGRKAHNDHTEDYAKTNNLNMGTFNMWELMYNGEPIFNIDAYGETEPNVNTAGAIDHYIDVTDADDVHGHIKFLQFPDTFTRCDKKKWADTYGIKWDGITNYNNCS